MIKEYISYLRNIKGYSGNTAIAYEKDLRCFVNWMKLNKPNARWSTITRNDLDAYITDLTTRGLKPSSTNRRLASISGLYGFMKRNGLNVENPARYESRRKIGSTIPNTIPADEITATYNDAVGATKVIIGLLMTTGMRVQELLDMRYEDIDDTTNAIRIHGKGNKERVVYSSETALEVIKTAKAMGYKGKIFPYDQRTIRHMVWSSLSKHSQAPQLSPHAIRHSVATQLAKAGANATTIANLLGHEHISTTQRYIDMSQQDIKHAQEGVLFTN